MRGQYGIRVVGVVDRLKIDRLTNEWSALYNTLAAQAQTRTAWLGWLNGVVEPLFKQWTVFQATVGETISPVDYKVWSDRLAVVRAGAKSLGMKPPTGLGTVALVGGGVVLGLAVLAVAISKAS